MRVGIYWFPRGGDAYGDTRMGELICVRYTYGLVHTRMTSVGHGSYAFVMQELGKETWP